MKFRILGPFEVTDGTRDVTPGAAKLRQVLGLLVLCRNQAVHTDLLIDELWGEDPPRSALPTLQTYVYKLRGILGSTGQPAPQTRLRTRPSGYVLQVGTDEVDVAAFERHLEEGRAALARGDPARAVEVLTQASSLWRGPALADVTAGPVLASHAKRLDESRMSARELRIEADLQLGRHREVLIELRELTSAHALHEGFIEKLMIALHRSGRRVEALEVYRQTRDTLIEEFGLEPAGALSRLQQAILASETRLEMPRQQDARRGPAENVIIPPAQLPPDTMDFVGRRDALAELENLLTPGEGPATAVRVIALTAMPGAGKTTVAIRAAHRARERFCAGQLFADLGGSTARPAEPAEVLHRFLRAVGIPPWQVPRGLDEAATLFRSWTARRSVLVLLDDAHSAAQVRPLLPGDARCAVIVTSRSGLADLAGVSAIRLGMLSTDEAVALLASTAGHDRVAKEPAAAQEIVRLCGRLPLAVRVAGTRLAAIRGWRLSRLAALLRDPRRRLAELQFQSLDVRSHFEVGCARVGEPGRSAFRLLSLLKEERFPASRVAAMLGCGLAAAEELLSALADNHLLRVYPHEGEGRACYGFHELAQAYACAQMEEFLGAPAAQDAADKAAANSPGHSGAISGTGNDAENANSISVPLRSAGRAPKRVNGAARKS